jgi:hypothetical protein
MSMPMPMPMPEPAAAALSASVISAPALFQASGPVAMLGWLALAALPRRVAWRRALAGTFAPLLLAAAYAGLIAAGWSRAEGGFDSFEAVKQLFTSDLALLAGWLHYLAFDLLIGCHIDERAERAGISRAAVIPAFVLTFLFGPAGWLLYRMQEWITLRARARRAEVAGDPDPALGTRGLVRWAIARADRALLLVAAANLALVPPMAVAALVDDRTLDGANIWIKPIKFAVSLAIYSGTLALMAPLAGAAFARSRARAWLVRIVIAASAIEMFWIVLQAARGTRSHFNEASPFEQSMYGVMGIFAVSVVLAPIGLAFAARRLPAGGLRSGLFAATLLNLLLGGGFGVWLSVRNSHFIGGDGTGASGLPFFGWSTTGGDLRIAHFVGLHAMQAMLAIGLLTAGWRPRAAAFAVWAAASGWTAAAVWLAAIALRGQPIF